MPRLRNSYILHQQAAPQVTPEPIAPAPEVDMSEKPSTALLDINSATKEEIAALPYLADKSAERILKAIAADGPFTDLDDMLTRASISHLDAEKQAALGAMIRFS